MALFGKGKKTDAKKKSGNPFGAKAGMKGVMSDHFKAGKFGKKKKK